MKRNDLVQTWFDTGAMGPAILYGRVTKAGPKRLTIEWESGIVNDVRTDAAGDIKLADNQTLAGQAMRKHS